jgi:dolichyl-phosphate beta-glucosyltransferase
MVTPTAGPLSLAMVVPMFNEVERFSEAWPQLADWVKQQPRGSELLFVDDGSSDGTADLVERTLAEHPDVPARLVRNPHLGKGAAVRAGLLEAHAPLAGFCDVDLSTPLDQLDIIAAAAARSSVLAIGSRDVAASQLLQRQSLLREVLGKLFNRLIQLTLAPGISDTQCGAKVAHTSLWHDVLAESNEVGFAWDCEIVAIARRLGYTVQEVAIEWRHDDRSRVRVSRDGPKMVMAVPRIVRHVGRVAPGAHAATDSSGVFDDAQASTLVESDTSHWWFRSKGSYVAGALRKTRIDRDGFLVDVGAGAGGVTTILGWRPDRLLTLDGAEVLVRIGQQRHSHLGVVGLGERLPLRDGAATVVTLLDVIEHLDDPVITLREAARVLGPDGVLVVTVPAHESLWSGADELLGHVRRYNRQLLRDHLSSAGFAIERSTHVFSWLVLPVWLQRRLVSDRQRQLGLDQRSPLIDAAALVLSRTERAVTNTVSLPFGTSILCVARVASSDARRSRRRGRTPMVSRRRAVPAATR